MDRKNEDNKHCVTESYFNYLYIYGPVLCFINIFCGRVRLVLKMSHTVKKYNCTV